MGKILLSLLSKKEQEALISSLIPLRKYTPKTITNKDELLKHLDEVCTLGYAIDDEEFLVGSRGIAYSVTNEQGQTTTSVSISGPSARLSRETLMGYLPAVKKASEKLSPVTVL
jgi:DNA-binding IclR family transcriptional regulator